MLPFIVCCLNSLETFNYDMILIIQTHLDISNLYVKNWMLKFISKSFLYSIVNFFREFSHPKSVNYLLNWKSDSRIILVMFFTYLRINYTRLIPDEYTRAKTNIGVLAVIEANKLPTDNHFFQFYFQLDTVFSLRKKRQIRQ